MYKIPVESLVPGDNYRVRLLTHKFLFGNTPSELLSPPKGLDLNDFKKKYLGLYNAATLPFYWGCYEGKQGKTEYQAMMKAAKWLKEQNIVSKGHPLCWQTVYAPWLMDHKTEDIYKLQMERITREIQDFQGYIDDWDVVNEAVIMPVYDRYDNPATRLAKHYGIEELVIACFKRAKEANPKARLLLNDFDLSADYEHLIERLLDRGCPIDAIGLQSHQHQGYRGKDYFNDVLNRFSRFGLPLHFTETTLISGDLAPKHIIDLNDIVCEKWPSTAEGEERQKNQSLELYTLLYAHPAVEAITWWGIADGGWLNAPSGVLRKDLSEKPVYQALKKLIWQDLGFPEQICEPNNQNYLEIYGPPGRYEIKNKDKIYVVTLE